MGLCFWRGMISILKKKQFWGTIIALILLGFCIKDIRLADVRNLLKRADLYYLVLAVVLQFLFIICKATRWRTIVESTKKIKWKRVVPLFAAGQAINIVMPALTGAVEPVSVCLITSVLLQGQGDGDTAYFTGEPAAHALPAPLLFALAVTLYRSAMKSGRRNDTGT